MSKFEVVPLTLKEANGFVHMWHRHLDPVQGHKFSIGAALEGVLVGVAIVGRTIGPWKYSPRTLEVTRVATDGTKNANSFLYAAAWRAAKNLGWLRLVTYNEEGESGASLLGAGWRVVAERPARKGWNCPSRPREDKGHDGIPRTLWEAV